MIQVCGSRTAWSAAPVSFWTGLRLSILSAAQSAATTISGTYTPSTIRGCAAPAVPITSRPTSWTTGTPMLPPPALSPSAQPFLRSGKKALMLVIDEAKLPPPMPVSAATTRNVVYEVPGSITQKAAQVGTRSDSALTTVQLRPPNSATAKVYGTRTTAPTRVAVEIRKNFPAGSMPYSGPMNRTITDHRDQTENPMCSESTENHRFLRAVLSPVSRQKVSSSGSHFSIQRPAIRRLHKGRGVVLPTLRTPRFGAVPGGDRCATLLSLGPRERGEQGPEGSAGAGGDPAPRPAPAGQAPRVRPFPFGHRRGRRRAATSSTQPNARIASAVSGQIAIRTSTSYDCSICASNASPSHGTAQSRSTRCAAAISSRLCHR